MWIEEIIVEGFKSYATRTVIGKFDPKFNAITGLNGSGKSNILDAICFVLGITNLAQVRVSTLQELVYKQGAAGVTRASVTIVFNNSDRAASPVGFEEHEAITVTRQVVVGGRSKYLLNGVTAPTNRVLNLFHSVQLNINNPHFLIMQGRITKVLNMRPTEVLAMIEEAAGTRMYEAKKQQTLRTIEKKQAKVAEIDRILAEDITPRLERLRSERAQYVQFASAAADIERLARAVVAAEFVAAERTARDGAEEVRRCGAEAAAAAQTAAELRKRIDEAKARIEELTRAREAETAREVRRLEDAAATAAEELVRAATTAAHAKELRTQEAEQLAALRTALAEQRATIERRRKGGVAEAARVRDKAARDHAAAAARLADAQRRLETASIGVSVGGSEEAADSASAADEVVRARKAAGDAEAEARQLELRIAQCEAELREQQKALKGASKGDEALRKELAAAEAEAERLRAAIAAQGFDPAALKAAIAAQREAEAEAAKQRERAEEAASRLAQLRWMPANGSLPPGVEPTAVHGIVAELIRVKRREHDVAIEVCAGGRLFNVVVDDEAVGRKLLAPNARLQRRITIIPLKQIVPRTLPDHVVRTAKQIACAGPSSSGREEEDVGIQRVATALSLVSFDEKVRPAAEFSLGAVFVCSNADAAQRVAFNPSVRVRCVTLAGDSYDPSGALTGGAPPSARPVLADIREMAEAKRLCAEAGERAAAALARAVALRKAQAACEDAAKQHELAAHRCAILRERLAASAGATLERSVAELQATIEDMRNKFDAAKEAQATALGRAKQLQAEMEATRKTGKGGREAEVRRLGEEAAKAKAALAAAAKELAAATAAADTEALELEALEREADATATQLAAAEAAVERAKEECKAASAAHAAAQSRNEAAKAALELQRAEVQSQSEAIRKLLRERDDAQARLGEAETIQRKAEARAQRVTKERAEAERYVAAALAKHPWIAADKARFGKKGTEYDLSEIGGPEAARARLATLQAEHERLAKAVNRKAVAMFDTAERDYAELVRKKEIVENDRAKIAAVIAELDAKKGEALRITWHKVNADFSSIFSSLLPGATAKLEPPSGGTGDVVVDGLEVQVALGGVWKEGLTELSGGQRSLLALSLILALLRFKPAPVYILDEVDAALDPSHTQNIGRMLATHFRSSQFIVVSLKKGMWANANVLFKARCVDGVSTVTRVASRDVPEREAELVLGQQQQSQSSPEKPAAAAAAEEEEEEDVPLKRRRK